MKTIGKKIKTIYFLAVIAIVSVCMAIIPLMSTNVKADAESGIKVVGAHGTVIDATTDSQNFDGIKNAVKAINKALKMANNSLLSLKTKEKSDLKNISLKEVIDTAVELSQVYLEGKNIEFQIENNDEFDVIGDEEKLVAVIINLVKNASEAFPPEEQEDVPKNGKYIKIKTEKDENSALVMVSNNATGISDPEKIFNEGFTTKSTGSGLGLWICKKSIEEQMGELELSRSTEDYTEFTIRLGV